MGNNIVACFLLTHSVVVIGWWEIHEREAKYSDTLMCYIDIFMRTSHARAIVA